MPLFFPGFRAFGENPVPPSRPIRRYWGDSGMTGRFDGQGPVLFKEKSTKTSGRTDREWQNEFSITHDCAIFWRRTAPPGWGAGKQKKLDGQGPVLFKEKSTKNRWSNRPELSNSSGNSSQ